MGYLRLEDRISE